MKRQFIFFGVMLMLTTLQLPLHGQLLTGTQSVGSGVNQLDLTVTLDLNLSEVQFEITGPANAWFGFAFNTTAMTPSDYTILANVSGGNPAEYIMQQHSAPILQPVQNLTGITSSTASGRITYVFYRALNTGDPNDYVFSTTPGNLDIAWAYGTSLVLGYHAQRGDFTLTFTDPCASVQPTILPTVHICDGDSALIFGHYESAAGVYHHTYSNPWSCDSIVTQELVVSMPVTDTLPAIHICPGDSALIFGHYEHTAGYYSNTFVGQNHCDSTVVQPLIVSAGSNFTDTIVMRLCEGDSVLVNGHWITQPGQYHIFHNIAGCDSIFHLYDVYQPVIDTSLTLVGISLHAVPGYWDYHWIDCATGATAAGSTNDSIFTPTTLGSYRVEIGFEGCTLSSSCMMAGPTSIEQLTVSAEDYLTVYPNPASSTLNVVLPDGVVIDQLNIYDLTGKLHFSQITRERGEIRIDISHLKTGSYVVIAHGQTEIFRASVIVSR